MAGQDVVVTYRADVSQLTGELNKIIAAQEEITQDQKAANAELKKNITSQELAAKKRLELLKLEEKELEKLRQLRKLAFDPKVIQDYDNKIAAATKNIQLLGGKTKSALGGVGASIKSIGLGLAAGIGAAFSVDAVIAFGKASVNAFLEADKTANKLKNTLIAVNGETEQSFDRLIAQSSELQKISIFSDDSIQQAQSALAAFGLTADQIEELIPKLADFATISNTDIVSAAQQVGAGLEGAGREFKKYGIEVDATKSRLENFNSILNGFVRFQGAASNAADTFAGRLAQQENAIDDLQEKIGQKLLPAFLKIKEFGLRAVQVIADLFGEDTQTQAEKAAETYGKIAVEFNTSIEVLKRGNITQEQRSELIKEINTQYAEYLPNLLSEKSSLEDIEKAQAAVNKQLEGRILLVALEEDIVRITKNSAAAAKALLQVQKDRIKEEKNLNDNAGLAALNRDQLNQREALANELIQKGRDELAGLQAEYAKLAAQLGINLTTTNKLLDAQEGINKATDVRIAGSSKEIELIQSLNSEYADLFALLSDTDKAKLIELSITGAADLEKDAKDKIKVLTALFEANKLELPVLVDSEGNVFTFEQQVITLQKELESYNIEIPVSIDETVLDNFRTKVAELAIQLQAGITIPVKLEVPEDRQDVTMFTGLEDVADKDIETWFDRNQAILQSTMDLMDSLQALSAQYTANRIDEINKLKDEQIAAIDQEQEFISEQLKKRRVSETEAALLTEQLTKKRLEVEADAAKKEQALKKKQFNIDKAAALIKIAINTAEAITAALTVAPPAGIVLAAINAAAGAAELAVVASQPNPYFKGTKSAKGGLANVDEKGKEAILRVREGRLTMLDEKDKVLPAHKTVTYGVVLDKMFDGTFDKHYMKREVAPRLVAQRKAHESVKQKSFAKNISESVIIASTGLTSYELEQIRRKGQNINNADEIGRSVARHLQSDPYRR